MMPPAPPRLSTMTCCLSCSESICASGRATMSVGPPGGKGTTSRTGLVGYVWAWTAEHRIATSGNVRSVLRRVRITITLTPPVVVWTCATYTRTDPGLFRAARLVRAHAHLADYFSPARDVGAHDVAEFDARHRSRLQPLLRELAAHV